MGVLRATIAFAISHALLLAATPVPPPSSQNSQLNTHQTVQALNSTIPLSLGPLKKEPAPARLTSSTEILGHRIDFIADHANPNRDPGFPVLQAHQVMPCFIDLLTLAYNRQVYQVIHRDPQDPIVWDNETKCQLGGVNVVIMGYEGMYTHASDLVGLVRAMMKYVLQFDAGAFIFYLTRREILTPTYLPERRMVIGKMELVGHS